MRKHYRKKRLRRAQREQGPLGAGARELRGTSSGPPWDHCARRPATPSAEHLTQARQCWAGRIVDCIA
eukprot:4463467-Alexandrium_andersonii.AAC.1